MKLNFINLLFVLLFLLINTICYADEKSKDSNKQKVENTKKHNVKENIPTSNQPITPGPIPHIDETEKYRAEIAVLKSRLTELENLTKEQSKLIDLYKAELTKKTASSEEN